MKRTQLRVPALCLTLVVLSVLGSGCAYFKKMEEARRQQEEYLKRQAAGTFKFRVAAWNVRYGSRATAQQVGEALKPYELDVIAFSEAPGGSWTAEVGRVLDMKHSYVGRISSAHHEDKYKSILSRTFLEGKREWEINGDGWRPASVVRAETKIRGIPLAVYSVHIPGSPQAIGSAAEVIAQIVLPFEKAQNHIMMGDFNNRLGEQTMNLIESRGLRATWRDLEVDLTKASTFEKPETGVIDHILRNKTFLVKLTGGGIIELDPPLSDHKPVWAEFDLPKKK